MRETRWDKQINCNTVWDKICINLKVNNGCFNDGLDDDDDDDEDEDEDDMLLVEHNMMWNYTKKTQLNFHVTFSKVFFKTMENQRQPMCHGSELCPASLASKVRRPGLVEAEDLHLESVQLQESYAKISCKRAETHPWISITYIHNIYP